MKTFSKLIENLEQTLQQFDFTFQRYRRVCISKRKLEHNSDIEEMKALAEETQSIANEIVDRLLQGNVYSTLEEKESIDLQVINVYWQFRNIRHANKVFGDKFSTQVSDCFDHLLSMIDLLEFNIHSYNQKTREPSQVFFFGFEIISPEEAKKLVETESL